MACRKISYRTYLDAKIALALVKRNAYHLTSH